MTTVVGDNGASNSNDGTDLESKKVHPFFVPPQISYPQPHPQPNPDANNANAVPSVRQNNPDPTDENGQSRKRRRTNSPPADDTQASSKRPGRPKANSKPSQTPAHPIVPGAAPPAPRQSTLTDKNANILGAAPLSTPGSLMPSGEVTKPAASAAPSAPPKILQFNPKTGTIGSPPKPKPAGPGQPGSAEKPAKRGRKRKGQMLRVNYGSDEARRIRVGQKIHEIIHDLARMYAKDETKGKKNDSPKPKPAPAPASARTPAPKEPSVKKQSANARSKSTHPFFLGKPKAADDGPEDKSQQTPGSSAKRNAIFTSTPRSTGQGRQPLRKPGPPQFGLGPGGLKVPGAQHPAWPWKGTVHVRGEHPVSLANCDIISASSLSQRKAKGQEIALGRDESILNRIESDINVDQLHHELKALNFNEFRQPPPTLRLPERHFESGKKLQARISQELGTPIGNKKTHPAVQHAFNTIRTMLPAFDRSTYETVAWAQKYAPQLSEQVLQSGREAELLRDWLQTLKIQAVDTGSVAGAKSKPTAAPKKRRRKKLDDFVVSSDDEMDELAEPDGDADIPSPGNAGRPKTVMKQHAKDGSRLTNSVLLSGPHGCGKTAAVYAMAKELDFEIFEISPGARRSGKDILEKVGDMTRNHLVQHQQKDEAAATEPTEDEVSRDLKSGKQGMMTNFFKPKPESKPAQIVPKTAPTESQPAIPQPAKDPRPSGGKSQKQKQSLILLEEVDILYEEDKHFWATVISMVSQSKRPFVMTCNDEKSVPLANLNLHGIFRFSNPPKDTAVDLLVLIAANEGHAISRKAIEALYDSRNHDLRASIAELNYWCQIGVGDPRGGFSWFYPRWPKGNDIDENGDVVRVVSENTYLPGMGWLGRDPIASNSHLNFEEEAQRQAWDSWSFDIYDPEHSEQVANLALGTRATDSRRHRLEVLEAADSFAQLMSDADLCSDHAFASQSLLALDTASPSLPSKTKEDFVIGRQLLEVSPLMKYIDTAADIASTMKEMAHTHRGRAATTEKEDSRHVDEPQTVAALHQNFKDALKGSRQITRVDYSEAFDPLALSDKVMPIGYLDPSIFDRTMKMITLDVAPYVRSIVAFDQRLQRERASKSSLVSEGGKPARKRVRNTRSAYSALEGGPRASTRREKYFSADVNPHLVMHTGGEGWGELGLACQEQEPVADDQGSLDPSSDMDVGSE